MNSVLLTGATGFVGSAVMRALVAQGVPVRALSRVPLAAGLPAVDNRVLGNLDTDTDYTDVLEGVDTVIHTAARVHVMRDSARDPLAECRATNVALTLQLAQQAARAGVKRLVFLSTIKVNGERTAPGQPFTATMPANPQDPYAQSKYEAEQGLLALAQNSAMQVVIIRPPLVYGPGVKGNFAQLLRWLERGIPLPLKAIRNQRSLVALDNLVDLILTCASHPAAGNRVFLVSDQHDLATPQLLQHLGAAIGHPARLFYLPPTVLRLIARLLGRSAALERLTDNLQVNIDDTCTTLNWQPKLGVDAALARLR